ncbi:hypothetical protein ABIF63_001517 [Bradyrhizobium japonicum]|uniref:DNA-directed DNA polymerase family A palm domain-containing protein n=1 Tax=Bradyrhizobium japonicum TaxID=375 RepID=A0ABV2RKE5_BRAJP|nr:hypothetical protein [Bradyrhizobium japonicum]UQD99044.1 hypothetical protein JEY30_01755 [Bradyrhizobium japonicum]
MLKHALSAATGTEASNGAELRDATFASLEGHPCTEASQALTEAVNEQVLHLLAHKEFFGEAKTNRNKLKPAIAAFLADLLSAEGKWVYRSLKKDSFTGPVGARAFLPLQQAMRELGLVDHYGGAVSHWVRFEEGGPALANRRWASRYRPTKKLIALAGEHGIGLEDALDHFDYGLPKQPLQKRAASTRTARRKVQGQVMKFEHTDQSLKLEADVRELNEFLAKQTFGGGCVHRGYVRMFHNGDAADFNWDQGGRLYSQPADRNYQQQPSDKRLEMTINGSPVVEIDLRASYLTIFHAWHGVQLDKEQDPYVIPGLGEEARDVVKLWVAATFGSTGPLLKWPTALLRDYKKKHGHPLDRKRYPAAQLGELIIKHHPLLGQWGQPLKGGRARTWAGLMFDESRVVITAMQGLMRDGVPSLAVHDSLIVPEQHERQGAMALIAAFGGHFRVGHIPVSPSLKINSRQGSYRFVP